MGYRFSLVLSREITEDESVALKEAGCVGAVFGTDSLPTNAEVAVTKMDFDDTVSPTLAEAIESALEAVKKVPDLSVPGLTVPAQPAERPAAEPGVVAGAVISDESAAADEPATVDEPAKKARKPRAAKKPSTVNGTAKEPVEASVGSD
jgi:hypothetical protein